MNDVFIPKPRVGVTMNWPAKGGPFVLTMSEEDVLMTLFPGTQLRVKTKLALSRRLAEGKAKFSTYCLTLDGMSRKKVGVEAKMGRLIEASSTDQVQFTPTVLILPTIPAIFSESEGFIRFGVTYWVATVGASAGDMDMMISA